MNYTPISTIQQQFEQPNPSSNPTVVVSSAAVTSTSVTAAYPPQPFTQSAENASPPSAPRAVIHYDLIRDAKHIDHIIQTWDLKELDDVAVIAPCGQGGNDGEVFKLFTRSGQKYAVKAYRSGVNYAFSMFQQAIHDLNSDTLTEDERKSLSLMRRAVQPVAWVKHMQQTCLVFEWIPNAPRPLTQSDLDSIKSQLDICHKLSYCHLDVAMRNVLFAKDGSAVLIDYDGVCRLGACPLGPIAPESSRNVLDRDPVCVADDDHMLQLLAQFVQNPAGTPTPGAPLVSSVHSHTYDSIRIPEEKKEGVCPPLPANYQPKDSDIFAASSEGDIQQVQWWIEQKQAALDECSRSGYKMNALQCAVIAGQEATVQFLLQKGASPHACTRKDNWSALHVAAAFGQFKMAELLLEFDQRKGGPKGRLVHLRDKWGGTAVHVAARKGHLQVMKLLIEVGHCNPTDVNNRGVTPLHVAAYWGHLPIVRYLVESCGVNVNWRTTLRRTALDRAAKKRQTDVVQYLESKGAKPGPRLFGLF